MNNEAPLRVGPEGGARGAAEEPGAVGAARGPGQRAVNGVRSELRSCRFSGENASTRTS